MSGSQRERGADIPIWGKSPESVPYPLQAHLLDSWVTAGAVWDSWVRPGLREHVANLVAGGDVGLARRLVQTAAALHDVGKANPVFQTQAGDSRELHWRDAHVQRLQELGFSTPSGNQKLVIRHGHPARRHEYVTGLILGGETPEDLDLSQHWLVQSVTGHHGTWHRGDPGQSNFTKGMMKDEWGVLASRIADEVVEWAGGVAAPEPVDARVATQAIVLVAGLVVLADWTASLDTNVEIGQELLRVGLVPGPEWVETRTSQLTSSVQRSLGWYTSPPDAKSVVMQGKASLRPLQAEAERVAKQTGLWMVTYPTGEGKTEASLLRHMGISDEGLIFALPTRATTNAMQSRLEGIFAETGNQVVLSHQFAARRVCATAGANHGSDWYDSSIRRLVAPVVAATSDQVLSGALRGKHAALRLTALANHHVILDEVHTYDHYQSSLLRELLHWWGATQSRVTLLSATMPVWQQRQFERAYRQGEEDQSNSLPYPGSRMVQAALPTVDHSGIVSAAQPDLGTDVITTQTPVRSHVDWVESQRKEYPGAHLAVVVNTVDRAIAVAEAVGQLDSGAIVICLHSRFTLADRGAIESDLLARLGPNAKATQPVVVVGTQVIEASLDIDVDFMSTDLCPAPSLVQRAGRCQRFRDPSAREARLGRATGPRVIQVVETQGSKPFPYLTGEIDRVKHYLSGRPVLQIPYDVQAFVDDTTFDLANWEQHMSSTQGREEIGEATKRLEAAREARADIAKSLLGRRPRYGVLNKLTIRGGEFIEDVMGTRFIDRPTAMYLFVSDQRAHAMQKDRAVCLDAVDASIPVNAELDRLLEPASSAFLAQAQISEWQPKHKGLLFMKPVDPSHLPTSVTYSPRLGLRKVPS